ncbi:hypothetical protein PR048_003804 [Dryococelus australis]|uniref:Anosmin-1 n=1 Tax=Dryococelus australis TaxID=614101 RepID=A0ABQ9IP65_9NEOP|nr:hypothetical protein PR048_003804 [Dryococelus australis]
MLGVTVFVTVGGDTCLFQCVSKCRTRPATKPGHCPKGGELSVFDAVCLEACKEDAACPGTHKCCSHHCGATCQHARGLSDVPGTYASLQCCAPNTSTGGCAFKSVHGQSQWRLTDMSTGLPEVPVNVTIREARRGRHVTVQWAESAGSAVLYLVQQRQHVGREYSAQRLGPWMPIERAASPATSLRRSLRPGRWYLFRVAAVGANGTRGFSQPSQPFTLSADPKRPAEPTNLTATSQRAPDGSYIGVLTWRPPASDLPIQRYRVYWSRRITSSTSTPTSVLRDKQCVPRHSTKVVLRNLLANAQYFLQVQALAQFGLERLKGEMAAIVLNTTGTSSCCEHHIKSNPQTCHWGPKNDFNVMVPTSRGAVGWCATDLGSREALGLNPGTICPVGQKKKCVCACMRARVCVVIDAPASFGIKRVKG